MEQQFTTYTGPSLEEVQQRFERWREGRKRGTPIPAALWEDAVCLCADHSLGKKGGQLAIITIPALTLLFPAAFCGAEVFERGSCKTLPNLSPSLDGRGLGGG